MAIRLRYKCTWEPTNPRLGNRLSHSCAKLFVWNSLLNHRQRRIRQKTFKQTPLNVILAGCLIALCGIKTIKILFNLIQRHPAETLQMIRNQPQSPACMIKEDWRDHGCVIYVGARSNWIRTVHQVFEYIGVRSSKKEMNCNPFVDLTHPK